MNNIVLAVLQGVVVMAVAPFFSGLGRVIRAKMHNRRGPSIMQDYRDLAKLFARPVPERGCELCAAHHAAAVLRRRLYARDGSAALYGAKPHPGLW